MGNRDEIASIWERRYDYSSAASDGANHGWERMSSSRGLIGRDYDDEKGTLECIGLSSLASGSLY